jgi:hypothetical protein
MLGVSTAEGWGGVDSVIVVLLNKELKQVNIILSGLHCQSSVVLSLVAR